MKNYIKGSGRVRRDLHLHIPFSIEQSYGDSSQESVWEDYITALESFQKNLKSLK